MEPCNGCFLLLGACLALPRPLFLPLSGGWRERVAASFYLQNQKCGSPAWAELCSLPLSNLLLLLPLCSPPITVTQWRPHRLARAWPKLSHTWGLILALAPAGSVAWDSLICPLLYGHLCPHEVRQCNTRTRAQSWVIATSRA